MKQLLLTLTFASGFLAAGPAAFAQQTGTLTVNATADIFSAGGNRPLPPYASYAELGIPLGTERVLTLDFTGGSVSWNYGQTDFNPDSRDLVGWPGVYAGNNKLSGVQKTMRWFAVYAVFLSDNLPDVAPAGLDYTLGSSNPYDVYSAVVAPELGQLFFVGDGRTAINSGSSGLAGTLQQFIVPEGATRVYFGFIDDNWSDNWGSYTYSYQMSYQPVPEPTTFAFLAATAAGMLLIRRRK